MAFVDVSGFTAMSERLSAKGKAGAEEVTDVMNETFARLLDVAYARGGGLLKFGGDALLLFFSGEDHAPRATRAAFDMRNTLREIGQLRTSAGQVTLRMHVGVHSGAFDFFLVGRSHRELLVTGPAATTTVEMEAASEAGEILVSAATAALLDPNVVGEKRGEGFLLRAQPEARGRAAAAPRHVGARPRGLRSGRSAAAHRHRRCRGRASRGGDRVRSLRRRGLAPCRRRAGGRCSRAVGAGRVGAGGGGGVRRLLPRERHRPRRRTNRPRRGGAGRVGERRGADPPHGAQDRRGGDAAPRAARCESRPRLRGRSRRAVPEDVHHPRRHRCAGGAPDGARRARASPRARGRRRALADGVRRDRAARRSRSRARRSRSRRSTSARSSAFARPPTGHGCRWSTASASSRC